ncbi:MAG: SpoIIIAH-like family protein [Clostridia bacterium]|nr:SpoIIIAH-like family protein [Clostridia bacterium]
MKLFKKNQVIIYVIVLMLMTAGYLNYTTNTNKQASLETAMQIEASDDMQLADIGDATLVNSNDVVEEKKESTENLDTNINTSSNSNINNEVNIQDTKKDDETVQTNSNNGNDYFAKSKLERDTMYSQMLETYEKVLNSSNSLETQKQVATQEIQKINETKNSIMICENLIKTKGFEKSIIFVNGDSVSVIIGAIEIKQEEVAQVQNIISREMKKEVENIHIATK